MKRSSKGKIEALLIVVSVCLAFDCMARGNADDGSQGCTALIDQVLDYDDEDRFRIMLSSLASESMYSAANRPGSDIEDAAACFQKFLENEIEKPLSLAQYQQVLFFLAENHFTRGEFEAAYQRYFQLKLMIRDASDPMPGQISQKLRISARNARSDQWKKKLAGVLNNHAPVIMAAPFFLVFLVLAGKIFAHWRNRISEKFKASNSLPEAGKEFKNLLKAHIAAPERIDVWKMREHDGRISEEFPGSTDGHPFGNTRFSAFS